MPQIKMEPKTEPKEVIVTNINVNIDDSGSFCRRGRPTQDHLILLHSPVFLGLVRVQVSFSLT